MENEKNEQEKKDQREGVLDRLRAYQEQLAKVSQMNKEARS